MDGTMLQATDLEQEFARYIKHLGGASKLSKHQFTIIKASFHCGIASCLMILEKNGALLPSPTVNTLIKGLADALPENMN